MPPRIIDEHGVWQGLAISQLSSGLRRPDEYPT